jgi:type II secretory pathway pseudopilin PulG
MASRRGKGFTIVELIVVITILIILTTLVVVRLAHTQSSGRDREREIEMTTIASGLEVYYENGNTASSIPKGYYPGGTEVQQAAAASPPFNRFLEGVSVQTFEAPDRTITDSFGVDPSYASAPAGANADGSYSDSQVRALLSNFNYLYQPLRRNNTFCASYADCVKFNLYYLEETTNTVKTIRSKNQ